MKRFPIGASAADVHSNERPVSDLSSVLRFADEALPSLRRLNGLMCYDRTYASPALRGESLRYSIIVMLGLLRREQAGSPLSIDPWSLHRRVRQQVDELTTGDLGLLLWAESRMGARSARSTLAALDRHASETELGRVAGMEIAWTVIGAVEACAAGLPALCVLERALESFDRRASRTSPLFHHDGHSLLRHGLPNFATQIYSLLALAELARHDIRADSLARAARLADLLIELRLDDGGWPWLYHADRGIVVERYEVYSVHQDAMAPMALLALSEVSGNTQYSVAALEGFQWCLGHNELHKNFYDVGNNFAHRSIRRSGAGAGAGRAALVANSLLAHAGRAPGIDFGGLEVNDTCRPYHLGWILEAWSGREPSHQKGTTT